MFKHDLKGFKTLGKDLLKRRMYKDANDNYRLCILNDPRLFFDVVLDFEKLLEKEPQNLSARLSLADFYISLNEIDLAINELEEVLDLSPDTCGVYSILGSIYLKRDETDKAIDLLENALEKGINDIPLVEMLAGAYLEKGDLVRAIDLYEQVASRGGKNKNTLRILGDLYTRQGDFDAAADRYLCLLEGSGELLDEVIHKLEGLKQKAKSNIRPKEILADIYSSHLKPELAVLELKAILAKDRKRADQVIDKLKQMVKIYPSCGEIVIALAEAKTLKGAYSEAVAEYNKLSELGDRCLDDSINGYKEIIKRYPQQVLAHQFLGDAYVKKGMVAEALEEFKLNFELSPDDADQIIKKCRNILKAAPGTPLAHEIIGDILLGKKDHKRAIIHGEEILAVDANNASAHAIIARAHLGLRDFDRAAQAFRTALSLDPYNISLHKDFKEARQGQEKEETDRVKRKISEDPWKTANHLDLAKIYIDRGLFDDAIKEIQIALKDQSRHAFAFNLLGLCYRAEGRFEAAIQQFKRSLEALPNELSDMFKTIAFNLGLTYELCGCADEAISVCENILQKDITFEGLKEKISYLSASHPVGLRNKMLVGVISDMGSKDIIGMWARDGRKEDSQARGDLLSFSFAQSHNQKGFDYYMKGMDKYAMEEFSLAETLDEKFPAAANNHGFVLMREGKLEAAESKMLRAIDEDTRSAALFNNLGLIKYLKGDIKMAELNFKRALSIDHEFRPAYVNLGDILYALGNAKQAVSYWERIKDFDAVREFARRRLKYAAV